jgi:hypothetical protein
LQLYGDKIYVADRKANKLSVFNRDGSFSHSIGSRGRGPREYGSVCAFYINPEREEIVLFDALNPRSALCFKIDGEFVKRITIPEEVPAQMVSNIRFLGNGQLVCYANPNDYTEDMLFVLREEDMSVVARLSTRPFDADQAIYSVATQPYSVVDDKLHFVKLFDDNIYEYDLKKSRPIITVDTGKPSIPADLLITAGENNSGNYLRAIWQLEENKDYSIGIKNLYETSRYIFCEFLSGDNAGGDFVVWDKKLKSGTLVTDQSKRIPGIANVVFSSEDTVVSYWPWQWVEGFQSWLKNGVDVDTSTINPRILEKLKTYDALTNNPLLFIYDMKK